MGKHYTTSFTNAVMFFSLVFKVLEILLLV